MTTKPDLKTAYDLKTPQDSRRLYSEWADSYDTDFALDMDYQLPAQTVDIYVKAGGSGNVLDIGAGTGLVGERLAIHNIEPIHGTDISPEMLKVAGTKGVYHSLFECDLTKAIPAEDEQFSGLISAGTFTHGHVGPEAFDEMLRVVAADALVAIAINKEHFESAGFAKKLHTISKQIKGLTKPEINIYGPNSTGAHANDRALLAVFRKA